MRPYWLGDQNQSGAPCVSFVATGPWLTPNWEAESICEGGRARIAEVVCGDCDVRDWFGSRPGSSRYAWEKTYTDDETHSNALDSANHADPGSHHSEVIDQTGFAWVLVHLSFVIGIEKVLVL
jgi:hypothetical protein